MAAECGMTCHATCKFSILTISPQSTCHSAPVCEILSQSDHPRQKKMTSRQFSRWQMSAILDFRDLIMGSFFESPRTTSYRSSINTICLNCLVFLENRITAFWRQTDKQTDRKQTNKQMDSTDALSRSCCRNRRLNKNFTLSKR